MKAPVLNRLAHSPKLPSGEAAAVPRPHAKLGLRQRHQQPYEPEQPEIRGLSAAGGAHTEDPKGLEYGPGTIYAGVPPS